MQPFASLIVAAIVDDHNFRFRDTDFRQLIQQTFNALDDVVFAITNRHHEGDILRSKSMRHRSLAN
jgi:hypothetical protein